MSRNKSHYFIQTLHKFVEVHFIKIIFGHMWRLKSCQKQFSLAKSYNLQFSACSKTLYHLQQLRLSFSYCFWYLICTCVWILIFLSCPFSADEYGCMLSMCLPDHLSLPTCKGNWGIAPDIWQQVKKLWVDFPPTLINFYPPVPWIIVLSQSWAMSSSLFSFSLFVTREDRTSLWMNLEHSKIGSQTLATPLYK